MQATDLTVGTIVFDPSAPVPPNKAYFRVVDVVDPQIGPWTLEQVAGRKRRTITLPKVHELEPHEADMGLDALIGKRVRFVLRFGSHATGTFECTEYLDLEVGDETLPMPHSFLLDGEVYPVVDVKRIEVLG